MTEIPRFSLSYDVAEDRMAWNTVDSAGLVTQLWLTQRLCKGLVAALTPLLRVETAADQDLAAPAQAAVQSWEQAAAMAGFGKTPGVRAGPQAVGGLVKAVHLNPLADRVDFTFVFGADERRVIGVPHTGLRQTLAVLHRLYVAAGWPLDGWPGWIGAPAASPPADAVN